MDEFFEPVSAQPNLPEREARVLRFWKEQDIFHESLRRRAGATEWVFYEGPPTANGAPGTHHVWARVFKDIYPRFQSMRGHFVFRKAGWDCHGLPVELEVEKELGITSKDEIEAMGVAEFNRRCRESVTRYVGIWNDLTERIGFWVDLDDAYWTMSPAYVESVWWNLKQMWDQDLLYESHRVVPYCPRCETPLSDHEVAQGYAEATDPSVFVRFPVDDRPFDLLVWTTTPWTLVSNTGVAAHPDLEYVTVHTGGERPVVVAAGAVDRLFGDEAEIENRLTGADLDGLQYRRPFEDLPLEAEPRVVLDAFVTTSEGSGLVHMAPAFGDIDMQIGDREGLAFVNPVGGNGAFTDGPWAGKFVKDADPEIVADLDRRGLLHDAGEYVHTYPFCWRCDTPLIYWAKASWFVRTSQRKSDLLNANATITWHPDHIKEGRFGDWLSNNVDWALSRDRYWGTPLPIWRCESDHDTCVGSFAELAELSGRTLDDFDPHRPMVDEIVITCPTCNEPARRLPPVIDAWFDSGSMPNAQWHYPFENDDIFDRRFPADFIAEAIDQTRGWFYSLLAISTLLWNQSSYRRVLSLGHIVDRDGRKMSKSVGNIVDPFEIIDTQGADALRWYFLGSGSAWTNHRVYSEVIDDYARRTLFTLWNTLSFFVTYAALDGWTPEAETPPVADRPPLDRWILSRLDATVADVTDWLDSYDAQRGARNLMDFVDDLSNWYVRRARPRFWRAVRTDGGGDDADKLSAYATLHECLLTTAKLFAPYTPFLGEYLYQSVTGRRFGEQESVHLEDWPEPVGHRDEALEKAMAHVRRVVSLGRTARTEARVRVRQPLSRLVVSDPIAPELVDEVVAELNVKTVEVGDLGHARRVTIKPNFARLGPRLGSGVKELSGALAGDAAEAVAARLTETGHAIVSVGGVDVQLTLEDVELRVEPAEGWAVAEEGGLGVALDLAVDETLEREGWLRELTHALQNARKNAGLAVADRINLRLSLPPDYALLVDQHRAQLEQDLLAELALDGAADGVSLDVLGVPVGVDLEKQG